MQGNEAIKKLAAGLDALDFSCGRFSWLDELQAIEKDLTKLEKYRDLFEKIKNSDRKLEYTGDELINYYEEIENDQ